MSSTYIEEEKKTLVNNWKCSNFATRVYYRWLKPLNKRVEEGREYLTKNKDKLSPEKFEKHQKTLFLLEAENIDLHSFYGEAIKMIEQHEGLVSLMSELYAKWYHKVSIKGKQPKEMMSMQREALIEIFTAMYEALKPLELDIYPPKTE